jgi:hypothetical protein
MSFLLSSLTGGDMAHDDVLVSLAREYLDVIERIAHGVFDTDELHALENERAMLHEQLLTFLGKSRLSIRDMAKLTRQIILESNRRGR